MLKRAHEKISSPEAVKASVMYDPQVCFWAEMLMNSTQLKTEIRQEPKSFEHYHQWRKLKRLQEGLTVLMLWAFICSLWYRNVFSIGLAAGAGIAVWTLEKKKRVALSQVFMGCIERNIINEQLTQKSLYQICEDMGRSYQIPGLVDVVYSCDDLTRRCLILGTFFFFFSLMIGLAFSILATLSLFIVFHLALKPFLVQKAHR
jgi:hypothetical protein